MACGAPSIPTLAHFMNDRHEDYWVRWALPKTIARIGGVPAMTALLAGLDTGDVLLRRHLVAAVAVLREAEPDLPVPTERAQRPGAP